MNHTELVCMPNFIPAHTMNDKRFQYACTAVADAALEFGNPAVFFGVVDNFAVACMGGCCVAVADAIAIVPDTYFAEHVAHGGEAPPAGLLEGNQITRRDGRWVVIFRICEEEPT